MVKKFKASGILFFLSLLLIPFTFSQEQITITTYYPSPYGSYRELRVQRMAIGNTYYSSNTVCWAPDTTCPNPIPTTNDTDLVVEGNVGIGTDSTNAMRTLDRPFKVVGSPAGSLHTAMFVDATSRYGIALGGFPDRNYTSIQAFQYDATGTTHNFNTDLILNEGGTGNVGVGTSTPVVRLDVRGGDISGSYKACSCWVPGNWRDTIMVPQGWTATTCSNWCTAMGATSSALYHITETGYSTSYP